MATIIFAAGAFLGLMDGTGMLRVMAEEVVEILPDSLLPQLHIFVGLVGAPLELVLSTDAFYFGLMPVMLEVVGPTGVPTESIVHALLTSGTSSAPSSAPSPRPCGWRSGSPAPAWDATSATPSSPYGSSPLRSSESVSCWGSIRPSLDIKGP